MHMEDSYLDAHMEDMLSGGGRYAEDEPHWQDAMGIDDPFPIEDGSMDGDHDSALRDAGFGTDEDYGYFGSDEE